MTLLSVHHLFALTPKQASHQTYEIPADHFRASITSCAGVLREDVLCLLAGFLACLTAFSNFLLSLDTLET